MGSFKKPRSVFSFIFLNTYCLLNWCILSFHFNMFPFAWKELFYRSMLIMRPVRHFIDAEALRALSSSRYLPHGGVTGSNEVLAPHEDSYHRTHLAVCLEHKCYSTHLRNCISMPCPKLCDIKTAEWYWSNSWFQRKNSEMSSSIPEFSKTVNKESILVTDNTTDVKYTQWHMYSVKSCAFKTLR